MRKIEVVAAIIVNQDRFLITKRIGGLFDGLWEFPGGKIESGETHANALIREINEELSITISVDKYLDTVEYKYDAFLLTMHLYYCSVVSGTIKLNDHSDLKWISLEDKKNIDWVPADVQVLELIYNSKFLCR